MASSKDKSKHAYVTLVMGGDRYVPGALVLAHSLRSTNTIHDIVCMVDTSVSTVARSALSQVFIAVITVPIIEDKQTRPMLTAKQEQNYSPWISKSYTKWNCLNLTQYDSVCFLDADNVAVENIDHLFNLAPPLACFTPFVIDKARKYSFSIKIPYPLNPPLGGIVPRALIDESINDRGQVTGGSIVILPTFKSIKKDKEESKTPLFPLYLAYISSGDFRRFHATTRCYSGPDEVSITQFMLNNGFNWHYLQYEYTAVPFKLTLRPKTGISVKMVTFTGTDKPWEQERDKWPDQHYFYDVADALVAERPVLRQWFSNI